MYNILTVVGNTVFYYENLLREKNLSVLTKYIYVIIKHTHNITIYITYILHVKMYEVTDVFIN